MSLTLDQKQKVQRAFIGGQTKESLMSHWNVKATELEDILSELGRNTSPKAKPTAKVAEPAKEPTKVAEAQTSPAKPEVK